MSHDPMCPNIPEQWDAEQSILWHAKCECDLIARVREDERKYGMVPGFDLGYAAAVRDAVEAVSRTCGHTKYEGCPPCAHDDAVAAIEGLEVKR